jgi:hypothetical protein
MTSMAADTSITEVKSEAESARTLSMAAVVLFCFPFTKLRYPSERRMRQIFEKAIVQEEEDNKGISSNPFNATR